MSLPAEGAAEAQGEGWKALTFPTRIALAVDPLGDNLPRALRELLTPVQLLDWTVDWQFVDRAGWDVYHLEKLSILDHG
jgi:hypothetical protein